MTNHFQTCRLQTIPRDQKVSKVVLEVEDELLKGAFKLYPKLKAYYELRGKGIFKNNFHMYI